MNIFGMKLPPAILLVLGVGVFLWWKGRQAPTTPTGGGIPAAEMTKFADYTAYCAQLSAKGAPCPTYEQWKAIQAVSGLFH